MVGSKRDRVVTHLAPFATLSSSTLSFLRQTAGEGITAGIGVLALVDGPTVTFLPLV